LTKNFTHNITIGDQMIIGSNQTEPLYMYKVWLHTITLSYNFAYRKASNCMLILYLDTNHIFSCDLDENTIDKKIFLF